MNIISFTQKYFKSKSILLLYVFLAIITGTLPLATNYILGSIIDSINTSSNISNIYNLCYIFIGISIFMIIAKAIKEILYTKLQVSVAFDMNKQALEHVKRLPISFFKNVDTIYLNQRINNDVNNIVTFFINIISDTITNVFVIGITLFLLISINKLIICIFILLIVFYILLYTVMKKRIYDYNFKMQESQSQLFSKLNEQISNVKFLKLHILFDVLKDRLEKAYDSFLITALRKIKFGISFNSIETIGTLLAQVVFIIITASAVINGKITIGLFSVLIGYFFSLIGSLKYFIGIAEKYQENLGSYNRIIQILNINKETNGDVILKDCNSINIENLKFSYNENLIFDNFNYTFKEGNTYCITGQNGSGKSTLINIICGLYVDEYIGQVSYNNIPIEDLNMYKLRKNLIGISEQEPLLLDDSVLKNLTVNNKDFDKNFLERLIDIFDIRHIVNKVIEENINVSGGEKQKISIIRLLLKDPKILIFDEPTSALDKNSVNEFKKLVRSLQGDKIIIIITHDKNLLDLSDNVINIQ